MTLIIYGEQIGIELHRLNTWFNDHVHYDGMCQVHESGTIYFQKWKIWVLIMDNLLQRLFIYRLLEIGKLIALLIILIVLLLECLVFIGHIHQQVRQMCIICILKGLIIMYLVHRIIVHIEHQCVVLWIMDLGYILMEIDDTPQTMFVGFDDLM